MGQQQLLLIVLGVIVVGIAVVAGINLFSASHDESIKDELVSQCMAIGANAQQFFIKPVAMGGGGNTFNTGGIGNAGYTIPASMTGTTNGTYAQTAISATSYTITATPRVVAGKTYSFATVTCVVSPTSMATTVN
ncbi:MAG: hypothetical protein P4L27_07825 [Ignavibacteriaceae bacterium]|nr:hypothetical protein [Ignavibacteriaceae bacterium]